MRAVIDTTSLVSFVRYYLPFDKADNLKTLFEQKFISGELIVLDKVFEESGRVAKGIVTKQLEFLDNKKKLVKTDLILPEQKFFNILENQLCYGTQKHKLKTTEFELNEEFSSVKKILEKLKKSSQLIKSVVK